MSESSTGPAADDGSSESPESVWLERQVQTAFDMGIQEVKDIRDLLNDAANEVNRDQLLKLATRVVAITERKQKIFRQQAAVIARMVDAPTRIAEVHIDAQLALIRRLASIAVDATPQELAQIMVAYSHMPAPYANNYYWPLGEDEFTDIESDDPPPEHLS